MTGEISSGFSLKMPNPKNNEHLAIVTLQTGAEFLKAMCDDKIERSCRVPGRLRRKIWLRENDVVIVKIWEYDPKKADIIWKYYPHQVKRLRATGILQNIEIPE